MQTLLMASAKRKRKKARQEKHEYVGEKKRLKENGDDVKVLYIGVFKNKLYTCYFISMSIGIRQFMKYQKERRTQG